MQLYVFYHPILLFMRGDLQENTQIYNGGCLMVWMAIGMLANTILWAKEVCL